MVDPLDRIIEQLEEEKAPLSARRAQLEAEIAELLKREERINAGIAGLKQGRPKKPAGSGQMGGTKSGMPSTWQPSQKSCDDVYAAIATASEPLTINQISEATGLSRSATDKTVAHLRSEQKIRLAGRAALPGGPKTYGTMP